MIVVRDGQCDPRAFLGELRRIEDALGRQRIEKWGPRTLDLDLLASDDTESDDQELALPHPWIARRPFVYLPFPEVADLHPAWGPLCEAHADGLAIERETEPGDLGHPVWGGRSGPSISVRAICATEEDTESLGRELSRHLLPGDLVALDAPMGAGKSVLARGIARGLGIEGPVQSPTYTLCRTYDTGSIPFEHWDFYRLDSRDDLASAGYEAGGAAHAIRAVEWAERFADQLGPLLLHMHIDIDSTERRLVNAMSLTGSLPFAVRRIMEARA